MKRLSYVDAACAAVLTAGLSFGAGKLIGGEWVGERPTLADPVEGYEQAPREYTISDADDPAVAVFHQNGRVIVEYVFGSSEKIQTVVYDENGVQVAPGFFRWCENGVLTTDWAAASQIALAQSIDFSQLANPEGACLDGVLDTQDFDPMG